MADINQVFDTLKGKIIDLAKTSFKGYIEEAQSDGQATLNQMKADITVWTQQYTNGDISKDELTFIIEGRKEEIEVAALTEAGMAQIQLDNFKSGVINLIETTIFSLV